MQFIDLGAQQERIKARIDANIQKVLAHGKYIMGPEVGELEGRLAQYVGVEHCVGCSSGTDALLMALMAKGVGPGDAIFTTPFTFIATAEVIALLGAVPVFVDIDPGTFNLDPEKLAAGIAHGAERMAKSPEVAPKGVVTVDLFGLPCDYERINEIAEKYGLFLIEDAAQALGGEYQGRKACALAEMGCTSFFPAKPLGGYGDGGAVFTDDDVIADALRSIRVHGKGTHKYDNARIGLNARLDTLQAAILLAKMDIIPEEIERRQRVAEQYRTGLSPCAMLSAQRAERKAQSVPTGYKSAWAQYSVMARDAEAKAELQARLKEQGVPTAVYYPKPLHLQAAFSYLGYKAGDFPVSEACSERIFSLPMHPYLKEEEIDRICECIVHGA